MYHRYFGLTEQPFSIAVDPRYLFMSARHRDALAHLLYGVGAGGGFILLTGPVGTGKTTITRSLLGQLPNNTDIALVLNPALNGIELLATICDELHITYGKDEQQLKNLTDKIHHYLLDNFSKGRNTVLLIDEAQHLHFDTLEQIRLLTNLETNTKKLLQIILVGQPELKTLLHKPELSQLAQRITARFQLTPLDIKETKAYIRHRLHVAGLPGNQQLFPDNIVKQIYTLSQGTPRIINVLCDRMLLGCYGKNKTVVDKIIAKQAISEVLDEEKGLSFNKALPALSSLLKPIVIVTLLLMAALLVPQLQKSSMPAWSQNSSSDPVSVATHSPWYTRHQEAVTALALHLGKTNLNSNCDVSFRCERLTVNSWQALTQYQRPVVLNLTEGNRNYYANLVAINNNHARLLVGNGELNLAIIELEALWSGDFTLIWQAPKHFTGTMRLGDKGPIINWLAQQFLKLDQQTTSLTSDIFNRALYQRVIIFQQENNLTADGVVGLKTLLKLEQQLNTTTLLTGSF